MIEKIGLFVLIFFGVLSAYELEKVNGVPPKEYWDKFVVLVWQYETDVRKDLNAYRSVNINGFHIDRGSGDKKLVEFSKENNIPYYVDHAADKGYLYLKKVDVDKIRKKKEVQIRPNSWKDPKVMEAMKSCLKKNISVTKNGLVLGYAFDDEISTGAFNNPIETDAHPASIKAYMKYQNNVLGKIKCMNPCSYEDVRVKVEKLPLSKWDISKWMVWRSYMDTYFADTLLELTKYANSLDPTTPAGFVGGQCPCAYGGYDYSKLTKVVQWIEAYDIGDTNEILRSFWKKEKTHVQTWFSNGDIYSASWFLWYYMVHGSRGVIAWPEGWFKNGQPAGWLVYMKSTIKEVQEMSKPILDINTEFDADPIAVYYSHPSIQIGWAMDSIVHGSTWPNRSSSLESDNQTQLHNRVAWLNILEDNGYQYDLVSYDELKDENFSKKYKVLILNRTLALSDKEAKSIEKFVNDGGVVIGDYLVGIFDENGVGRREGILDKLFDIKRDESKGYFDGKTVTEVNGELYENKYIDRLSYKGAIRWNDIVVPERGTLSRNKHSKDKVASAEVIVKNNIGKGKAVYLNLTPLEYNDINKRTSKYGEQWRGIVREILEENGIKSKVKITIKGKEFPVIESIFWKKENTYYLCVVANPTRGATTDSLGKIEGLESGKEATIEMRFTSAVKTIKNLRTNKELKGGENIFKDKWKTYEANVYELKF
ncbi:MAG: beta-galactosidase trimerization domain-containing protein [Candidatus Firestonebacteria bacterium]